MAFFYKLIIRQILKTSFFTFSRWFYHLLIQFFSAGSGILAEALFEEEIRDIKVSAEHTDVTLLSSQNENTTIEPTGSNGYHQLSAELKDKQLTIKVTSESSCPNHPRSKE